MGFSRLREPSRCLAAKLQRHIHGPPPSPMPKNAAAALPQPGGLRDPYDLELVVIGMRGTYLREIAAGSFQVVCTISSPASFNSANSSPAQQPQGGAGKFRFPGHLPHHLRNGLHLRAVSRFPDYLAKTAARPVSSMSLKPPRISFSESRGIPRPRLIKCGLGAEFYQFRAPSAFGIDNGAEIKTVFLAEMPPDRIGSGA